MCVDDYADYAIISNNAEEDKFILISSGWNSHKEIVSISI